MAVIAAGFLAFGVSRLSAQERKPFTLDEVKAKIVAARAKQTAATEQFGKVDPLYKALDLKVEGLELNADTTRLLLDGAKALKASPIGGDAGQFKKVKDLEQPLKDAVKELDLALKDLADPLLKDAEKDRDAKKADRDAKQKTLAEKKAAIPQVPAEIAAAEMALMMAESALQAAEARVQDITKTTTEATTLKTELNASSGRVEALITSTNNGSFAKVLERYFACGKKLVALQQGSLDGTGFPKLAEGPVTADPQVVAKAFSAHSLGLSRLEPFAAPLQAAADPLRAATDAASDGYGKLAAGLVPEGAGMEAFDPARTAGNEMTKGSRDQFASLKKVMDSLDKLFLALRDGAVKEHGKVASAVKTLREAIGQGNSEEFSARLLGALETLKPGLALAAEQRLTDEVWPVGSASLNARWPAEVKRADAAFKLAREDIDRLRPFLSLIDDFRAGDVDSFVSQHVRLYYLPSVPRLIKVLNESWTILNPDGRAAIEKAEAQSSALRKLELEMADNLGAVVNIRRRLQGVEEEVRLANFRVKNAQKQHDTILKQQSELAPKKADADKAAADQQTNVNDLKRELDGLKSQKTSLDASIVAKKAEIAMLMQAIPPDPVAIAKADAELKALMDQLSAVDGQIATKQPEFDAASSELARKNANKDFYQQLFDAKQKELTEAKDALDKRTNERDKLTGDAGEDEASLKALRKRQTDTEVRINEQRRNIELDALAENRAFGEATEKAPIFVSKANALSPDPVKRVTLFGFGDSKTLLMRGKPEDVEKTLEIIAGFDAPAPQARVTLWNLQFNGDNSEKMNNRLRDIDESMADLRSDISYYQETLRNSINRQVNQLQQDLQSLTGGTPLELSPRLRRTLFYTRELRERLGLHLPCDPYWHLALAYLRVKSDFDEMESLAKLIAGINARLKHPKLNDDDQEKLRGRREQLDNLLYAAFEQLGVSFERFTQYRRAFTGFKCSTLSTDQAQRLEVAVRELEGSDHAMKALYREAVEYLKNQRADRKTNEERLMLRYGWEPLAYTRFNSVTVSRRIAQEQSTLSSAKSANNPNAAEIRRLESNIKILNAIMERYGAEANVEGDEDSDIDETVMEAALFVEDLGKEVQQGELVKPFQLGRSLIRKLRGQLKRLAQNLLPPANGPHMRECDHGGSCNALEASLSIRDAEYVTGWTIPDPAHSTTVGEAMFVLTMSRRSQRLAVLRGFARELVRQRAVAPNGKRTSKASRQRYDKFTGDCINVLQGLVSLAPSGSGNGAADPGAMPRFPGLPKALLGAVNSNSEVALNDDELTANQHEVLLALLAKGRSSCGIEIQHLVRQIQWYQNTNGNQVVDDGYLERLRDQYIPLVGWLSVTDAAAPPAFREELLAKLSSACRIPTRYRVRGLKALEVTTKQAGLRGATSRADRVAWSLARDQVRGNSVSMATPRVAAADDMIKRLIKVMEDDVDYYFVSETLEDIQRLVDARPTAFPGKVGSALRSAFGLKNTRPVRLGIIERTSVLATNRLVARVSPNATAGLEIPGAEDFLLQSQQLAQLGQGINNSFFAPERSRNALGAAGAAAGLSQLTGLGAAGPLGALLGAFSLLEEQRREPPGEVYTINSGNTFKLTPIFDPSGQALRFKFDHVAMTRVREPDGTLNPLVPRVERMSVNTEVQLSNLELGEVARFSQNTQLGTPERRTGGVPFLRSLPILKDIPLVGYYTRQKGKAGVVQSSVILGQSVIYPTVGEIVDLLVDQPRRLSLGDLAPEGLWEPRDRTHLTLELADDGNKPVPHQEVVLFVGADPVRRGKTDPQGIVEFPDLKQQTSYDVRLDGGKTVANPIRVGTVSRERQQVRVLGIPPPKPGPAVLVRFRLHDPSGQTPAANLFFRLLPVAAAQMPSPSFQGTTDSIGEFRIPVATIPASSTDYRVEVGPPNLTSNPARIILAQGGPSVVDIRVEAVVSPLRIQLLAPFDGGWLPMKAGVLVRLRRENPLPGEPPFIDANTDDRGVAHFFTMQAPTRRERFTIATAQTGKGKFIATPSTVDFGPGDRTFLDVRLEPKGNAGARPPQFSLFLWRGKDRTPASKVRV